MDSQMGQSTSIWQCRDVTSLTLPAVSASARWDFPVDRCRAMLSDLLCSSSRDRIGAGIVTNRSWST